jgi:hypothetical protein
MLVPVAIDVYHGFMPRDRDKIDLLQEILKRNLRPEEIIGNFDLRTNESYHYFYFDCIRDPNDLELAWSIFPENKEIRRRLKIVERAASIIPGWGYRVAKETNRCDHATLKKLIRQHIRFMRPLVRYEDIGRFLDKPFEIVLAPKNVAVPDDMNNDLLLALDEGPGDFFIEHYPIDKQHYWLLDNWAIYLTKCDEVARYLLWPCLRKVSHLPKESPNPGFRLWTYHCRDRYWIKDGDLSSGVVYFRPPTGSKGAAQKK